MFSVMLFLLLVYFSISLFLFFEIYKRKTALFKATFKEAEDKFVAIVKSDKELSLEVLNSEKQLTAMLSVYEITKELSKFLDQKHLLDTFRHKVVQDMGFSECRIFSERKKGYELYPIKLDGEIIKYVGIKTAEKPDDNLIQLTLNQLILALRRSKLYQEIQELSITDSLTGVYNKRYFMERFAQELLRAKHHNIEVSILMLDIDHFKSYNDTYGHLVGDMLLKEVSNSLKSGLRQIDMCARWGGEEFCILLPDTKKDGSFLVGERLRLAVEKASIRAYDENLKITVSIGAASFPEDAQDITSLVDKADQALYKAKSQGRNMVFVYGMK